jgi:hypothetical protein
VKGCVNDRKCTGRYRKTETPKCRSFLEYKGIMESHIRDLEDHACVFVTCSTDKDGKHTLPVSCKNKGCNGIDKKCDHFEHNVKSRHHKPNKQGS